MIAYALANLGSILCGIVMVVGGILLLYKGAIKLEVASKDPALTVELFERQFKLTTQVPALGLFVIGLLFVGLGNYYARQTVSGAPLEVTGNATDVDANKKVKVKLRAWAACEWLDRKTPASHIHYIFRPTLDMLYIDVTAAGYESQTIPASMNNIGTELDLGEVKLSKQVDLIEPNSANIFERH